MRWCEIRDRLRAVANKRGFGGDLFCEKSTYYTLRYDGSVWQRIMWIVGIVGPDKFAVTELGRGPSVETAVRRAENQCN